MFRLQAPCFRLKPPSPAYSLAGCVRTPYAAPLLPPGDSRQYRKNPSHSPFIKLISRMAVLGVPSSASRWISFSATISDVVRERPCSSSEQGSRSRRDGNGANPPCRPLRRCLHQASRAGRSSCGADQCSAYRDRSPIQVALPGACVLLGHSASGAPAAPGERRSVLTFWRCAVNEKSR